MFIVTASEMQKMDLFSINSFRIPERVLMENAGKAAADYFLKLFQDKIYAKVGIIAGKGNNGGDAYVVARYLNEKNIDFDIFLLSEKSKVRKGAASENLNLLISLGISIIEIPDINTFKKFKPKFKKYSIWIDAILGVGLKYPVKGFLFELIQVINELKRPVFAIDIPSGLSSDTGQILGNCIKATATVTFAYAKIGHFVYPGAANVGKLKIVDIGIPSILINQVNCLQQLLEIDYIRKHFNPRKDDIHKGTNGHLIIIAGSPGKTGASVMASLGAMRSGVGLVTLCIPKSLIKIVAPMLIETMTLGLPETCSGNLNLEAFKILIDLIDNKQCVVFGPGIGTQLEASSVLEQLILHCHIPIVIDADGLNIISDNKKILSAKKAPLVLTPHPGEMARLVDKSIAQVQRDRVNIARKFAHDYDVHIVLKGAATIIAHPNGKVFINSTGNSGMASGGMGDVLSGMIGSFISQGYAVDFATQLAVFIHGLSGDYIASLRGPYGYLATDLIKQIPKQISLL